MIIRQGHKAENFYFILSGSGKQHHTVNFRTTNNMQALPYKSFSTRIRQVRRGSWGVLPSGTLVEQS